MCVCVSTKMSLQIYYEFQSILLLQEPLLVVVALYLFFVLVIIMVRLDFSIRKVSSCNLCPGC